MEIVQIKPFEQDFYHFIKKGIRKVDVLILCEGKYDVEYFKKILTRLNPNVEGTIGLADCEGLNNIPFLTQAIIFLTRMARKLRVIGILIDAEEKSVTQRLQSIKDSLSSQNITLRDSQQRCSQVFSFQIKANNRSLDLLIAINGIFKYGKQKHSLEDHVEELFKLTKINIPEDKYEMLNLGMKILEDVSIDLIRKAFFHVICMVETIAEELSR